MQKLFSFERLLVYQQARQLVKCVYMALRDFPREETYALCDQLRRAVVSVASNIAEGMSRRSPNEQTHFIQYAFGSLMEVMCQLDIAYDLGYISEDKNCEFRGQIESVARLLNALHTSINNKK